jgi:hypothetical protein
MMYKRAAIFLALGILPSGIFAGGKKDPPPSPPPPSRPPVERQASTIREATPAPEPPKETPTRPVTRDILELIGKSAYEMGDLQYFISSAITLERGKGMQIDIEIKNGEGLIQEINAHETIIIPKDTGGVLISESSAASGIPRTLTICFDDEDERALTFRENPADNRFYLVFREDRQSGEFTEYGDESFKVNFSGAIPYLYVRLDAISDNRPRTRELRGRFVRPRETPPEAPVAEPVDEEPYLNEVPSL